VRWNALAMVVRANRLEHSIGGHIPRLLPRPLCTRWDSIIFSAGALRSLEGDTVYFQGHAAPGMYARAFLEGRLSAAIGEFSPRTEAWRWPVFLSASMADA